MQFFDIVALKETADLEPLARRLGYRRIFALGKDAEIVGDVRGLGENGRFIVRSKDNETLLKAMRINSVVGVVVEDGKAEGKFIEELRSRGKLLIVPVAGITCPLAEGRMRALYRAKTLIRSALRGKAGIALVTLAEGRDCLLSRTQMQEMAKLLGADDRAADAMLNSLGDAI
ncbi:Uncharacterised protein [uncultured archaeon]|nr:Uncharacterised protein [uncultured archaeon]